jgi:hypothetical protein
MSNNKAIWMIFKNKKKCNNLLKNSEISFELNDCSKYADSLFASLIFALNHRLYLAIYKIP